MDYERNFNKREIRYARKLVGFVTRLPLPGGKTARKLQHWCLDDKWKETPAEMLRAWQVSQDAEREVERLRKRAQILSQLVCYATPVVEAVPQVGGQS